MSEENSQIGSPKIVVIGGGTGSFTLLSGLKEFTPNISALVNMSDDGGSTGRLRDEHGVLPPGDVRQCLVALSRTPEVRDLFNFRFDKGELGGHSAGNILLSALELMNQDFVKAVSVASRMLNIVGEVLPITTTKASLLLHDGPKTIKGEFEIAHLRFQHPEKVWVELSPECKINPSASKAIKNADIVVVAPGNFYGSILPALSVGGVKEALGNTRAKIVMVVNLVTKPGQTDGWEVADYVEKIEKYIGSGVVNYVLYNTELPSKSLLEKYAYDGEYPVARNQKQYNAGTITYIGDDFLKRGIVKKDPADKAVPRTLIRHDAEKVSRRLMRIYYT